jgi:BirA family biotin operon repressor/biotin-[acetyl-CoA-carboxylase] ligase
MEHIHFKELGSTNDHLTAMAEEGAKEWTVVTADRQTSGRGRRKNDWWSPEGNLHMSILLRPAATPRELLRLPVTASLAFLSAMGRAGRSLTVKWPNDILLDGRKMAGILMESKCEEEKVQWVVVGFGVNMTLASLDIPDDIRDLMAFVHELDSSLKPDEMASRIVSGMKAWSGAITGEGWVKARKEWARHAQLNVPYVFKNGGKETRGVPVRLDDWGGLVMETDEGEITVYSGEVEEAV